jgi:hypothetical protein
MYFYCENKTISLCIFISINYIMAKGSGIASGLGLGAGIGLGSTVGNTGGVFVCNAENQNTTYCQFLQAFSVFKILLWFLILIAVIVYFFYWFSSSKRVGKMKGGCGCGEKLW